MSVIIKYRSNVKVHDNCAERVQIFLVDSKFDYPISVAEVKGEDRNEVASISLIPLSLSQMKPPLLRILKICYQIKDESTNNALQEMMMFHN